MLTSNGTTTASPAKLSHNPVIHRTHTERDDSFYSCQSSHRPCRRSHELRVLLVLTSGTRPAAVMRRLKSSLSVSVCVQGMTERRQQTVRRSSVRRINQSIDCLSPTSCITSKPVFSSILVLTPMTTRLQRTTRSGNSYSASRAAHIRVVVEHDLQAIVNRTTRSR